MKTTSALFLPALVAGLVSVAGCAGNTRKDAEAPSATYTASTTGTTPTAGDPIATDTHAAHGTSSTTSTSTSTVDSHGHADDHAAAGTSGTSGTARQGSTASTTASNRAATADRATTNTTTPSTGMSQVPATAAPAVVPAPAEATNTERNERDRNGATLTPFDQGGSEADRKLTASVRRAVVGDGALSFTAKNVKIITIDGKVTLRGPVKNATERTAIEQKAKSTPGVKAVDNQLEVKE